MSNIKNYNFNNLDAYLSNSEYYDYYLSQDGSVDHMMRNGILSGDCLTLWIDFKNNDTYLTGGTYGDTIKSLVSWNGAVNEGYSLNTFGLTGIDNGYVTFDKVTGDTSNNAILSALTGTTVVIPSGDTRFTFNSVTGMTGNYIYPKGITPDVTTIGNYSTLCGGFYQGYFKLDGTTYQTQPLRHSKAWAAEFWLNKSDDICSGTTGTTLNDKYPNNKGFFFYMGTRSENKFWNFFDGNNTGCTTDCIVESGCTGTVTTFCTIPKETEISITGDTGYPVTLHPPTYKTEHITNNFLIYGRADKSGGRCGYDDDLGQETVCSYTGGGVTVTSTTITYTDPTNPFLLYGRADKNGGRCEHDDEWGQETICSYSGGTPSDLELDPDADIVDNAIGFRIKDDGSIGYRLLTKTCTTGETPTSMVTIEEGYSVSGVVSNNEWQHVVVRFVMPEEYDECDLKNKGARYGRLMFYVNSKLKFVVDDVSEVILRRLEEYKDKQLGVPFNYSLGGGSQGLLESMTFDGQDPNDLGLNIEKNFAGTFIGSISQFRFYNCDLDWCMIGGNYKSEFLRYGGTQLDYDRIFGPQFTITFI